jgi:hypothetical protein
MFRALEREWNSDRQDRAVQLLEDIALKGKMGKRVPIPVRTLVLLQGFLVILLVILLAVNFAPDILKNLPRPSEDRTPVASAADKDRATLLQEIPAARLLKPLKWAGCCVLYWT